MPDFAPSPQRSADVPTDAAVRKLVADGGDAMTWGLAYVYAEGPGRSASSTTAMRTHDVGMPFALRAKAARPDEPAILFVGDRAFGFSAMEFESAARQGVPVICVAPNNCGWGDVAHEQDMWFGEGRRYRPRRRALRQDGRRVRRPRRECRHGRGPAPGARPCS
ncbi:MAG: hypothetical protein E4H03_14545 [Myxococcales bacterium]|nr:MAG: hypothetical protein E4H03_14545 [Myxococcales bacterium]